MFVTEWYKGSNNTRGLLRNCRKGQTTSEVGYGVVQWVRPHQTFVTECYKGSKDITGLLRSGTNGQRKSQVSY